MSLPPGNYNLQNALNKNVHPVFSRMKLGDVLNTLINAVNALTVQADIGLAVDAGVTYNTGAGTLTVGGSVTNLDWFTVTFVNASLPLLVTPGLVLGPVNIVTGDTTTTVAAKLAAIVNASPTLTNYGVVATSAAAVATVKVPGAAASSTVMTAQLSSGATITVTPANQTGGAGALPARNAAAFPLTPLANIP